MTDDARAVLAPRNKYGAKRVEIDGYRFDSQAEARRYGELRLLQQAGEIAELQVHPRFSLDVKGRRVAYYSPDFCYLDLVGWAYIVEDVKSAATRRNPTYRLKAKLLRAIHGITVRQVEA